MSKFGAVVTVFALLASAQSVFADADEDQFVDTYRCAVLHQLDEIHARKSRYEENRYLVIDTVESPLGYAQNYVQCASDRRGETLCEAASGFYADVGPRKAYLSRASVASLVRLGFSADDSRGNFQQHLVVPDENARAATAEMMLRALYESYGIRLGHHLRVNAPLLREDEAPLVPRQCPFIS